MPNNPQDLFKPKKKFTFLDMAIGNSASADATNFVPKKKSERRSIVQDYLNSQEQSSEMAQLKNTGRVEGLSTGVTNDVNMTDIIGEMMSDPTSPLMKAMKFAALPLMASDVSLVRNLSKADDGLEAIFKTKGTIKNNSEYANYLNDISVTEKSLRDEIQNLIQSPLDEVNKNFRMSDEAKKVFTSYPYYHTSKNPLAVLEQGMLMPGVRNTSGSDNVGVYFANPFYNNKVNQPLTDFEKMKNLIGYTKNYGQSIPNKNYTFRLKHSDKMQEGFTDEVFLPNNFVKLEDYEITKLPDKKYFNELSGRFNAIADNLYSQNKNRLGNTFAQQSEQMKYFPDYQVLINEASLFPVNPSNLPYKGLNDMPANVLSKALQNQQNELLKQRPRFIDYLTKREAY